MMNDSTRNKDAAAAVGRIVAMATDPGKGSERHLFDLMQGGQEFTLGLSTLLACLHYAEERGAVPRVSGAWWCRVASIVCDGGVFRKRLRSARPSRRDPEKLPEARLRETGIFDHNTDPMHDCMEQYEFHMRRNGRDFNMGLSVALTCLSFAEGQGAVPQLSPDWWSSVCCRYPERLVNW